MLHPNSDWAAARILLALHRAPLLSLDEIDVVMAPQLADCPLTVRELQILGAKAAGLSYTATADTLGIGVESVKTIAKRAYNKIGVQKRPGIDRGLAAVVFALREGWL